MYGKRFSTGTLAQVATVLAKEYGVRVQIGGNKAYTCRDADTSKWYINVPALATSDEYYMDIMRCYLDHEAGHVRFSDMNLLELNRKNTTYVFKSVWNIFEDIYIERRMSRSFPGCARNLRVGAEHIFSEDTKTPEDAASALLNYVLLTSRYNATGIKVFESGINMLGNLLPNDLKKVVDGIVSKLPTCNSTKATMDLAKELCDAIEEYINNNIESDNLEGDDAGSGCSGGSGKDGGTGSSSERKPSDVTDELGDACNSSMSGDACNSSMSRDGSSEESSTRTLSGGGAAGRRLTDTDVKEAILEALRAANNDNSNDGHNSYDMADRVNKILSDIQEDEHGSLGRSSAEWRIYKSIDDMIRQGLGKYVGKLSDESKNEALKESAKLASQLAGLLQTMVMNRGGFATRGKLDPKRIARVAVGRPDIFSSHVDKRGLDTEVIIAVDISGSMSGHDYSSSRSCGKTKLLVANQALMSILVALKGIQGVRSMAYMYSDFIAHVCSFSDTFTRNSRMVMKPIGCTPTGDAVQHAMTMFSTNAKRRILILLTDGEPDDSGYFKASVRMLKKQDVEIVGIGILDDSLSRDMSKEEHIIVNELSELSPKLFKILRDKLVRNA